ncbi:MAG TPA: tRNA (adenosine(37)-N6)-dimethylallyltransferase MiaA [Lachnospiraceae bacterium]|nr:tRNA (adenosine(37)-N6)-dimethylallyltransferase MiaA [Lachnospiraceae bacterium]
MKKPLIVLTGPTSVGKTKLSIELARKIGGEIISADSMQVYRHMDIGSAKITKDEMEEIPHHLIDILDPTEKFSVVEFQRLTKIAMDEIYLRGNIPILVGGTGFYIQSVLYDVNFTENQENTTLRIKLEEMARVKGVEYLHNMLKDIDPKSALEIHENNFKKVIRALEFYQLTGMKISDHNYEERQNSSPYHFCYFVLNDDREKIYNRINKRVDKMIEDGLLDEVLRLQKAGCTRENMSMQGIGYKEIISYLEGEITLEEAINLIKRDTRHFAKRQLTWFRREKDVIWINKLDFSNDEEKIIEFMLEQLTERLIL